MAKKTGKRAASHASSTLRSKKSGSKSKGAAGSALSQRKEPKKVTSPAAAKKASSVLSDKRSGRKSKSAAGSALSQTEGRGFRSTRRASSTRRYAKKSPKSGSSGTTKLGGPRNWGRR